MKTHAWKFTFRDGLILLLILIVAFLFIQKLSIARQMDRPDSTFEIVIRAEDQPSFVMDQVKVGDKLYQKNSPVVLGEIVDVQAKPATNMSLNLYTGKQSIEVVPDQYDITITMKAVGFESIHGSAIFDNNEISLNQYLVVNTNRVYLPTRVVSIVNEG